MARWLQLAHLSSSFMQAQYPLVVFVSDIVILWRIHTPSEQQQQTQSERNHPPPTEMLWEGEDENRKCLQ